MNNIEEALYICTPHIPVCIYKKLSNEFMYKEHVYLSKEAKNVYRRGHKYVHIPGCIRKKLLNNLTYKEHVKTMRESNNIEEAMNMHIIFFNLFQWKKFGKKRLRLTLMFSFYDFELMMHLIGFISKERKKERNSFYWK